MTDKEFLKRFDWLQFRDIWYCESKSDPTLNWYLQPLFDNEGNFVDVHYYHGSYATNLSTEPTFWVWDAMVNGDSVAEY